MEVGPRRSITTAGRSCVLEASIGTGSYQAFRPDCSGKSSDTRECVRLVMGQDERACQRMSETLHTAERSNLPIKIVGTHM